jgi:hypothetical protein
MALNVKALRMLSPYLRNAKILCLGYPDLLCDKVKLKEMFDVDVVKDTDRGRWHTGKETRLPESMEFFEKLNSTVDCIDIAQDFGIERVVDLNHPHDLGSYDLVIDPGTIEHCFNIGQAIINAANAVKVFGRIFHIPPMTMLNHGFYNICPTLLHDFYTQNGWDVEYMAAFARSGRVEINRTERFMGDSEASLYCIAQRKTDKQLIYPVQTKYLLKMEKANAKRAA